MLRFSIHIPKTGGTSFRHYLETKFPGKIAYWYAPHHPRTHPYLTDLPMDGPAGKADDTLKRLEDEGYEVLHGHYRAIRTIRYCRDPQRYWTVMRDPVERIISLHYYQKSRGYGVENLETLLESEKGRDQQARMLRPLRLRDMGFVGITETLDQLIGTRPPADAEADAGEGKAKGRINVTRNKGVVSEELRARIREANPRDVSLYARAKRIAATSKLPE